MAAGGGVEAAAARPATLPCGNSEAMNPDIMPPSQLRRDGSFVTVLSPIVDPQQSRRALPKFIECCPVFLAGFLAAISRPTG